KRFAQLRRFGRPLAAARYPAELHRADPLEPEHQRRLRRAHQHCILGACLQSLYRHALSRLPAETSALVAQRDHPRLAALLAVVAAAGYLLRNGFSEGRAIVDANGRLHGVALRAARSDVDAVFPHVGHSHGPAAACGDGRVVALGAAVAIDAAGALLPGYG